MELSLVNFLNGNVVNLVLLVESKYMKESFFKLMVSSVVKFRTEFFSRVCLSLLISS